MNKVPTVFISYAHEPGLREQVRELADWLLEQGPRLAVQNT